MEIPTLDTEALKRVADTLGQPEAPAFLAPLPEANIVAPAAGEIPAVPSAAPALESAPAMAAPAAAEITVPAAIVGIPDWLQEEGRRREAAAAAEAQAAPASEFPDWLQGEKAEAPLPEPEAPVEALSRPETEEERMARMDKQVQINDVNGELIVTMDGELYFGDENAYPLKKILEILKGYRALPTSERDYKNMTDENLDYAIAKLEVMKAEKEAVAIAGRATAVVEAPAPVSFAVRVEAARGLVEEAARDAGLLPEKIAEESRVATKRRQELPYRLTEEGEESGILIPEMSDDELKTVREARKILRDNVAAIDKYSPLLYDIEHVIDHVIDLQDQYKLGREMAADANKKYGAELAAATKELTPGWFEREPAVVKEMAELQKFFDGIGNRVEVEQELAEARQTETMVNTNFKKLELTAKQKQLAKQNVETLESQLETLNNLDVSGLLARKDLPPQLRAVIEARRTGKPFEFGTGPVAEFRRRVYESITGTLGIEAAPAVEVVEAVAPAAPAPEPEPAAPVETAEQIRQKAEKEFLGEDELDLAVSQAQTKLRESAVNGKANPKAVAEALAKQAEQNPGARGAVVAGAKQLAIDVLAEARREGDPKKRQKMLTWVKDFGVGFEATAMVGELGFGALDALISAIVNELGGQK